MRCTRLHYLAASLFVLCRVNYSQLQIASVTDSTLIVKRTGTGPFQSAVSFDIRRHRDDDASTILVLVLLFHSTPYVTLYISLSHSPPPPLYRCPPLSSFALILFYLSRPRVMKINSSACFSFRFSGDFSVVTLSREVVGMMLVVKLIILVWFIFKP